MPGLIGLDGITVYLMRGAGLLGLLALLALLCAKAIGASLLSGGPSVTSIRGRLGVRLTGDAPVTWSTIAATFLLSILCACLLHPLTTEWLLRHVGVAAVSPSVG